MHQAQQLVYNYLTSRKSKFLNRSQRREAAQSMTI